MILRGWFARRDTGTRAQAGEVSERASGNALSMSRYTVSTKEYSLLLVAGRVKNPKSFCVSKSSIMPVGDTARRRARSSFTGQVCCSIARPSEGLNAWAESGIGASASISGQPVVPAAAAITRGGCDAVKGEARAARRQTAAPQEGWRQARSAAPRQRRGSMLRAR